ncbi:Acyl-CoA dehydrogenase [Prauserella aidingensis]|uniref:acyl-CoA dehydrogenase family protein n=1 Tax=Prauserella aidingensis TaxID=387890 RepID=UPI0020A5C64A|nr:acyl-CoA dehydrogenase family protein [Prauserella aidingensis]MCP2256146.1 Acyl-CoA dehydrogenase [Prauserella aidingensis]
MTTSQQLPEQSTAAGTPFSVDPASAANRDRLLAAVEEIATEAEAEAEACEADGKLTDRALDLLRSTGIGWGLVSAELGGLDMYPGDVFPVLERIARIDGSIGWIATIVASSGPLLAYLDPAVAKSLLADGLPIFAASGAPSGRAVAVKGGYRFSGSYSYSSGGLHADWVFCGGVIYDGDEPVSDPSLSFLVPSSAAKHSGNWDTLGLRGTGSVDFTVTDEFVPTERVINMFGQPASGGAAAGGGAFLLIHLMHLGFAAGITRRLLDELARHAQRPSTRPGATSLADNPAFRTEYAEHELAARSARALITETLAGIDVTLARGDRPSRRQISLLYGANVHIHDTARKIASWVFTKGGGTALRAGTLQRLVRDAYSGGQHFLVDHSHLTDIGHELLGAPPEMQWAGPFFAAQG